MTTFLLILSWIALIWSIFATVCCFLAYANTASYIIQTHLAGRGLKWMALFVLSLVYIICYGFGIIPK